MLVVRDLAVATSGTYERGEHIRDPRTGRAPTGLLSVTVVGPSLTWADVYATTAFAMGEAGPAWVATHPGYGALAITADRRLVWTPVVEPLLGLKPRFRVTSGGRGRPDPITAAEALPPAPATPPRPSRATPAEGSA